MTTMPRIAAETIPGASGTWAAATPSEITDSPSAMMTISPSRSASRDRLEGELSLRPIRNRALLVPDGPWSRPPDQGDAGRGSRITTAVGDDRLAA
jgi:hypothetical protein